MVRISITRLRIILGCLLTLLILLFFSVNSPFAINAQTPSPTDSTTPTLSPSPSPSPTSTPSSSSEDAKKKQDEIHQLEERLNDLQGQSKTLANQIAVMDNQVKLTQLRINATRRELQDVVTDIETTSRKITNLEQSLSQITKVLIGRIIATYEVGSNQPIQLLLSSGDISDFIMRANYLRIVQAHDKRLIYDTQQAKNDYANQKEIFEAKRRKVESLKKQLEAYTAQLDQEKKSKQALLEVTKNDEKRYQDLLAKARSEYEAIQGIVAGNGTETEIGPVTEGKVIASVIAGPSCNSSGAHLHFIVSRNSSTENPFNFLRSGVNFENCSGSSCGSSDGDSFSPSGNWNWPLEPSIKMFQGYGQTWAVKYTYVSQIYNFHNGIDIFGSSLDVKAVKDGILFQGSYGGGGGCRLRYVRVHHNDSGLDTFYLHINYVM